MLKEGIYEQIIYEDLKNQLMKLDSEKYLLQKEPIDVEEAKSKNKLFTVYSMGSDPITEIGNEVDKFCCYYFCEI